MSLKSDAVVDRIRARLAKIDPNNRTVTHVYKCKITVGGNVAKTWILDLKNVKLTEGEGEAECTLIIDDQAFSDLAEKKITAKDAVAAGTLDVDGDMEIAMKLMPFIAEV